MKHLLTICCMLLVAAGSMAQNRVPARRDPLVLVQPNGDVITARLIGDEAWHAYQTLDERLIIQAKDGWWYYARESKILTYTDMRGQKRHKLVKTNQKVKSSLTSGSTKPSHHPQLAPPRDPGKMPMLNEQYNTQALAHRIAAIVEKGPHRVVGVRKTFPKVLVIMANFSNYTFVSPKADVDSMFNGQHWTKDNATGSIRQYFSDQSNGAYSPQFDVVGPVTLSQGYAYYGAGRNTSAKVGYMVTEACALVDNEVNFADYDTDGDGKVDMVFVLYAGFGENDPPTTDIIPDPDNLVWPHYWTISNAGCGSNQKVFDGKTIEDYECANELDGLYSTKTTKVVAGIGVMVHEFCHGLGLPDLYNTQTGANTMGMWDVMDYGPYNNDMHTPPSLTAYERWWLGWLTPMHLNNATDITLAPLSQSPQAAYLTTDGSTIDNILSPNPGNFYLVENRQQTGWDMGVPGAGLLLWQIQYNANKWNGNAINTTVPHGVSVLHADGKSDDGMGRQGDCYPYGKLDSILVAPNYPITGITQSSDGTMNFKVCGGKKSPTELLTYPDPSQRSGKYIREGKLVIVRGHNEYDILGHENSQL